MNAEHELAPFRLTYTGDPFDRAAHLRADAERMRRFLTGGSARILPLWNQHQLFSDAPRAVTPAYDTLAPHLENGEAPWVFLGLSGETPWFALGLPESETPPDLGGTFRPLNDVVALLPGDEAAILAYARAILIWHGNRKFCGRCGSPLVSIEAGHSRLCTNDACKHRSFPRTDPAVITLIEDPAGERCLLGRQPHWRPGQYSVIAGFVEPGESLEDAVKRESVEEAGVPVTDVRYVASQPWPFPASIMLGFRARATATEIKRIDGELEDCRWFSRADLRQFGREGTPFADLKRPRSFSIASHLVERWLSEK